MKINQFVRNVYPQLTQSISELPDLPIEEIKKALGQEKIYKLSFNENPLGPSPAAIEAMKEALLNLNLYPDSTGEAVKQKIAEMEGVTPNQVILTNGADEMILFIAQTFLEPDDEVIIPQVTFVQYYAAAKLMGAKQVIVPMTDDLQIDLTAILERITDQTKAVFLCNPNNPTGHLLSSKDISKFLEQIPEHVLVVVDEAYHEYLTSPDYQSAVQYLGSGKLIVVIRTFSKIYSLASARIGYGIALPEVIEAIHHVRPQFNVNRIAQAGALASLQDRQHVERGIQLNETGKNKLYAAFDELGLKYIKGYGNFVYVDTGKDSQEVSDLLASKGVIVRTLKGYGLQTALRISVGNEEAVDALIQALKEIFLPGSFDQPTGGE